MRSEKDLSKTDKDLRAAIDERLQRLREQLKQQRPASKNQRRSVRRPFACVQRIAPYSAALPSELRFFEVRCRDISTSGFSFESKTAPQFAELVVELGVPPDAMYVIARTVRVQPQADKSYVVGCEFTGRHS